MGNKNMGRPSGYCTHKHTHTHTHTHTPHKIQTLCLVRMFGTPGSFPNHPGLQKTPLTSKWALGHTTTSPARGGGWVGGFFHHFKFPRESQNRRTFFKCIPVPGVFELGNGSKSRTRRKVRHPRTLNCYKREWPVRHKIRARACTAAPSRVGFISHVTQNSYIATHPCRASSPHRIE